MPTTRTLLVCALSVFGASTGRALAAQDAAVARPALADSIAPRYATIAERIMRAALRDTSSWERLGTLTDTFGHRLSGSTSLERAIDWILAEMRRDGLDNPRTEPVKVPHWVRGQESATLVSPRKQSLPMLGLGGSVATPKKGITARVLVVSSFDELRDRAAEARGRIVLFDTPFTTYGATVRYRRDGASEAAKAGAVAALIRSVASGSIRSPHTGAMRYDSTAPRIPIAALTVEDAAMLHRMQDRGDSVVVSLYMEARTLPDADSRNVMAEITGRERPEEVVVIGGHIDSWDVGTGAMDDAGGVVAAWEAVRILKDLGLRPRRTIRVVGWTNEENGGRGGQAYRDARARDSERHVLAIESDGGVFRPLGVGYAGPGPARAVIEAIAALLDPISADSVFDGGGGADIAPLMADGVPGMDIRTDGTRYFWYHHSEGDTLDKLDPDEVARCVAVFAVMAYVVADLREGLPGT